MYTRSSFTKIPSLIVLALLTALIACFALNPKAHAVVPPSDGAYAGNNTAEGAQALQSLTTGINNTAIGFQALFGNTNGGFNTAEGVRALFSNTGGVFNTATGSFALNSNNTGRYNVADGFQALYSNTTGSDNTANGVQALFFNTMGNFNTATGVGALYTNTANANTAHGFQALLRNTTGFFNTADGNQALYHNTIGTGNIALGSKAGFNLTVGNNNIDIGNQGVAGESGMIRIGTPGTHTTTLLAGKVGIGVTTPATTFHVAALSGVNTNPAGHVALIKDESAFTTILALQSGWSGTHDNNDNFITFFNSVGASLGSIEGNNAGSVQLSGAGSDYAEYLPKVDSSAHIAAAEIVGVRDGRIVARGAQADHFMVVTAQAIVAGNRPSEDEADLAKRSLVAFIGQVPVQVRGAVKSGDYILASEKGDGTGIAMPAAQIPPSAMHRVVGRAWEASDKEGLKTVNAVVGVDRDNLVAPTLERLARENQDLRTANTALTQKLDGLVAQQQKEMQAVVARLKEQEAKIQKVSAQVELKRAAPQMVSSN